LSGGSSDPAYVGGSGVGNGGRGGIGVVGSGGGNGRVLIMRWDMICYFVIYKVSINLI
jgi:hypothetical protein